MSKLDIRGAVGDPSSSPSVRHGCLSSERPSSAALLATGPTASPGFAEVVFEDTAGGLLPSAAVSGGPGGEDGVEEEAKGEKAGLAHVVGPGELGIRGSEKDAMVAAEGSAGGDDDDEEEEEGDGAEKRWVGVFFFLFVHACFFFLDAKSRWRSDACLCALSSESRVPIRDTEEYGRPLSCIHQILVHP